MKHRYSVVAFLRTNAPRKDGNCAVYIRAVINRKPVPISLGIHLKVNEWHNGKAVLKDRRKQSEYNMIITKELAKANEIFIDHRLRDIPLTPDLFRKRYKGSYSMITFNDFLRGEIERHEILVSKGTLKNYRNFENKMKVFRPKLQFAEIDQDLLDEFKKFLDKKRLGTNSKQKQHSIFRKFIRIAIRRQHMARNPYDGYKVAKKQPIKHSLSQQEVLRLVDLYYSGRLGDRLQNVLEYFIGAIMLGGMRYGDVAKLTAKQFIGDSLIHMPGKTSRYERLISVPIIPFTKQFLEHVIRKREQRGIYEDTFFKVISNQKTNVALKQIAFHADIKIRLTFHVARHTFGTLFLELGGDVDVLMDIMGISKYDTIKHYIHVAQNRKKEQMSNFNTLLSQRFARSLRTGPGVQK